MSAARSTIEGNEPALDWYLRLGMMPTGHAHSVAWRDDLALMANELTIASSTLYDTLYARYPWLAQGEAASEQQAM